MVLIRLEEKWKFNLRRKVKWEKIMTDLKKHILKEQ